MSVDELKAAIRGILDNYWKTELEDPEDIDDLIADREDAVDALAKIGLLVDEDAEHIP